jgi:hypothetical protein
MLVEQSTIITFTQTTRRSINPLEAISRTAAI